MPNQLGELPKFDLSGITESQETAVVPSSEDQQPVMSAEDTTPPSENESEENSTPEPEENLDINAGISALAEVEKKNILADPPKDEQPKEEPSPATVDQNAERDKDLPSADSDPHMRPKVKRDWNELRTKAVEARNYAAQVLKEKQELEARLKALEDQVKQPAPIPKEIEEKLKTYQERVRELDIAKDPEIQTKYDKRISDNVGSVVNALKGYGLGDDDAAKLSKNLSLSTLRPILDKLEEAGELDAAESIRETVRENIRLGKERDAEITAWKASYEVRQAERIKAQQAQAQADIQAVQENHAKFLNADLDEIAKVYPGVKRPADPAPTDAPAVVQAKLAAIAEYDAAKATVDQEMQKWNGNTPEVRARITSSAVKAIILQNHVLPKIHKELQSAQTRIKELEAQVGKTRQAAAVNKGHMASISAPAQKKDIPAGETLMEGLAAFAKAQNMPTD